MRGIWIGASAVDREVTDKHKHCQKDIWSSSSLWWKKEVEGARMGGTEPNWEIGRRDWEMGGFRGKVRRRLDKGAERDESGALTRLTQTVHT